MLACPSKSPLPLSRLVERRTIEKSENREAAVRSKVQHLGDEMEDANRDKTLEEARFGQTSPPQDSLQPGSAHYQAQTTMCTFP